MDDKNIAASTKKSSTSDRGSIGKFNGD